MVELKSTKLEQSYLKLISIKNASSYIQEQTFRRNDDGFLKAIGFPYIGKIKKDRKKFVGEKIDAINKCVLELIVVGIVSDFEKIVFDRVDNASGEISKIVKNYYNQKPFKEFATEFVKSANDIDKLSVIKSIISPKLPSELSDKFTEIIDFRNRIAHGNRFGKQSNLSIEEIVTTLDDVLGFV